MYSNRIGRGGLPFLCLLALCTNNLLWPELYFPDLSIIPDTLNRRRPGVSVPIFDIITGHHAFRPSHGLSLPCHIYTFINDGRDQSLIDTIPSQSPSLGHAFQLSSKLAENFPFNQPLSGSIILFFLSNRIMSPSTLQDILKVHPATDSGCAAFTPSKWCRRSYWTNRDNRSRACELLATANKTLQTGQAVEDLLVELALLLLCTRCHQDQASTVVEKWKTDLHAFRQSTQTHRQRDGQYDRRALHTSRASSEESAARSALGTTSRAQDPVRASQSESTSRHEGRATSPSMTREVTWDREVHPFLTDYAERVERAHRYLNTASSPMLSLISRTEQLQLHTERDRDETSRPPDEQQEGTSPSLPSEPDSSPPRQEATIPTTRRMLAVSALSIRQKTRALRSRTGVRRKPIEAEHECGICLDALLEDSELEISGGEDSIVWCRAQCGNSFHSECLLQWIQSCKSHQREGSCPSCRATWVIEVGEEWQVDFLH
jgi:hypothetical protein